MVNICNFLSDLVTYYTECFFVSSVSGDTYPCSHVSNLEYNLWPSCFHVHILGRRSWVTWSVILCRSSEPALSNVEQWAIKIPHLFYTCAKSIYTDKQFLMNLATLVPTSLWPDMNM